MRDKTFYPVIFMLFMLSLNSCFGPDIHDIQSLAEKKHEFELLRSENDYYRFNNPMTNGSIDSWTELQKQDLEFRTQKKLDDINRDIKHFEKTYADKHGKAKLYELQKAAWVYETSGDY